LFVHLSLFPSTARATQPNRVWWFNSLSRECWPILLSPRSIPDQWVALATGFGVPTLSPSRGVQPSELHRPLTRCLIPDSHLTLGISLPIVEALYQYRFSGEALVERVGSRPPCLGCLTSIYRKEGEHVKACHALFEAILEQSASSHRRPEKKFTWRSLMGCISL